MGKAGRSTNVMLWEKRQSPISLSTNVFCWCFRNFPLQPLKHVQSNWSPAAVCPGWCVPESKETGTIFDIYTSLKTYQTCFLNYVCFHDVVWIPWQKTQWWLSSLVQTTKTCLVGKFSTISSHYLSLTWTKLQSKRINMGNMGHKGTCLERTFEAGWRILGGIGWAPSQWRRHHPPPWCSSWHGARSSALCQRWYMMHRALKVLVVVLVSFPISSIKVNLAKYHQGVIQRTLSFVDELLSPATDEDGGCLGLLLGFKGI